MNEMMNEYRELFIEEAEEYIQALNDNLIALEKNRNERKIIDNVFRIAHTLKSSSAAVGLTEMSGLAHKAEDVMQKIRSGESEVSEEIVNVLLEVFDVMKAWIEAVKAGKTAPDISTSKVIQKLEDLLTGKPEVNTPAASAPPPLLKLESSPEELREIEKEIKTGKNVYRVDVTIDPREVLKWLRAEILLNNIAASCNILRIFPDKNDFLNPKFDGSFCVIISTEFADRNILKEKFQIDLIKFLEIRSWPEDRAVPSEKNGKEIQPAGKTESAPHPVPVPEHEQAETGKSVAKTTDTIRVSIDKLDSLMNQIGELATSISGMRQLEKRAYEMAGGNKNFAGEVSSMADKLANISSDLQYSIMSTRLLPIAGVFNQFNRVVRDLSKQEKKEVELKILNEETELDKKIIDSIGDPLMHLVRNSIDHGIETPQERRKAGKPDAGTITLSASRTGNHILITVTDDGRGIDIEKVRAKAVLKNLISEEASLTLSDDQVTQFIFQAGFSTAEKISSVSGRGVGLDVVKEVLGKMNGTVEIKSEPGMGTEFSLLLPLTLTTTSVILAMSGQTVFAISINDIQESLSIEASSIQSLNGLKAIKLRDQVLPILSLHQIFEEEKELEPRKNYSIIVVNYRDKKLGVIVDRIMGNDEIVLKPLERNYRSIRGISGAAILGDGRVVLSVDVPGLIQIIKKNETAETLTASRPSRFKGKPVPAAGSPSSDGGIPVQTKSDNPIKGLFTKSFNEAALSLSRLTGREMDVSPVSEIELLPGEELINRIREDLDSQCFGSLIKTHEGITANILLILDEADGLNLYDSLMGNKSGTSKDANEEITNSLGEINNILSSTFINNIAELLVREVHPTTPINRYDMLGAIMESVILQEEIADKKILCADTVIGEKGREGSHARLYIMTDKNELDRILKKQD